MSRKRRSKPKPVRVALAERLSAEASPDPAVNPYPFLDELVRHHHPDLLTAAIAVVWRYEVKPDKDGRLWIGAPRKPGDLDRALHRGRVEPFDLAIVLNWTAWQTFDDRQRRACLDHYLSRFALVRDDQGEPAQDAKGRTVYRVRKPPAPEFPDVVWRWGVWHHDLEELVAAADAKRREEAASPLFAGLADQQPGSN